METQTEITRIDPQEYGLDDKQVHTIEEAFMPKIVERDGMRPIYEGIITQEITPALCADARELRLKLVKVRTGIADIHRTQKAFYLAASRFIDAWKSKETLPVAQMEEKLMEIEKYYENLEKERKENLRKERLVELAKYDSSELESTLSGVMALGEMTTEVWDNFISGVKLNYEKRKKAEAAAEKARLHKIELDKTEAARKLEIAPYRQFITEPKDLRNISNKVYTEYLAGLKTLKAEYDKEQERIRVENERLKKEREKLEAKQEAERKKLAEERAEAQRKEQEARAALAEQQRQQKEKEAAERKAKEDAERAIAEEAKRKAMAPDKEKLLEFGDFIASIKLPDLSSPEAKAIAANVGILISKIDIYIKQSTANL